jgi:hypothetical protein
MITDEQLQAAGFVKQADGTLVKQLVAIEMPYVADHIIDDQNVWERSAVIVSVLPGRLVEMRIPDFEGASEPPVPMDTIDGRALLRDAGMKY